MQSEEYEYLYALEENFWWFAGMREVTAAVLDACCPPGPDRVILDAGCGTGSNLGWLRRYAGHGRVFGIDVSTDALRFCRARDHRLLLRASVAELPFAAARFDLLTSFDVLAQISGAANEAVASEMFRVLRPGGIVFVRTAAYEWMRSGHDEALGTKSRYSIGALESLLRHAGFSLLRATYANSMLLPVAAARRLVLKPVGLVDRGSDVKPLTPGLRWLNSALRSVLNAEASWLRAARLNLPAGLSVICVAQKPADW
ncbi:MAG: class I SAM-dependent methyltransferase [Pyrinomonadaceae bacterium]